MLDSAITRLWREGSRVQTAVLGLLNPYPPGLLPRPEPEPIPPGLYPRAALYPRPGLYPHPTGVSVPDRYAATYSETF